MGSSSRYLIGIDLGTTNSAVAYIDTAEASRTDAPKIHTFSVPQLAAEGEIAELPTLPSFLFIAREGEQSDDRLRMPWQDRASAVAGVFAREQGALRPGQQIASAKSWLCHDAVDRTAKILPWNSDRPDEAYSPVEASTEYLAHLRDAWNHALASNISEARFERQEIVLTVPASFDEEARELTVRAARDAGLENLTLLEEPLAAFYAWMVAHFRALKRSLKDGQLILICDVGGGTTDFSLIRASITDGNVEFERTAIGEHLLLGGDNVDLALRQLAEEKLGRPRLSLRQRNALARQCCLAKEMLLSDPDRQTAIVQVMGEGRSVIGGALSTELTHAEVERVLLEGFLPLTSADDLPARSLRAGLRELGLPYATEAAITRHLAEFLKRSATADADVDYDSDDQAQMLARPDAVLFNGGFFTPEITRQRIVKVIAGWFAERGKRWRPRVLTNDAPESAVAVGAAYYGMVRRGGGLRVRGGSARSYYVGVQSAAEAAGPVQAVCVMPRGTEEGTSLELGNREFAVLANRPVSFTLYSSTTRHDNHGDVVTLNEGEIHRHAPLITVLRFGKKSRQAELAVQLRVNFTEVGTLELWCESLKTEHRWRLQFQLRGEAIEPEAADDGGEEQPQTIIADETIGLAAEWVRAVFGDPRQATRGEPVQPESLTARLEAIIGYGKDGWPMGAIRKLCDVLAETAKGRKQSARHEARWLNLFGFCLRPGFGAPVDDWRISEARKVYHAGLVFPKDIQCQVEWFVLWRRVAGGLNAGQQQELYQRHMAALGIGGKGGGKKVGGRINTQIEREGWRMLASLEHLAAPVRVALGNHLLAKIRVEPSNKSFLWSLGRLGARIPLYGPLNCVVPVEVASRWIKALV
ncbi:MAG TPA: Hsp70 family protein, partial [Blastocatellia bacterium]|nr:Hsp70 family protein [Blastocatellia bacterium]